MAHGQSGDTRAPPEQGEESWLESVEHVLDASIDREEPIECTFEEFDVAIPMAMGADPEHARWEVDGSVRVSVEGTRGPLADWLRWWHEKVAE